MNENTEPVTVAGDLEPLIPQFMANRTKELQALKEAAATADFAYLQRIGHRMKGIGDSYGFRRVTELGKRIEECAKSRDSAGAVACVQEYARYLERIRITYV